MYLVSQAEKTALLLALLAEDDLSTLVFTRTKHRTDKVARMVERAGHRVSRLHSNRSQSQRQQALDGFKDGKFRVLVATDIAARGIDVAEIGHVVNFDLPHVPEDYVHRIGRTARMAASGKASSFCGPEETGQLRDIERLMRKPVPRVEVPRASPVFQSELRSAAERVSHPGPRQPGHGVSGRPAGQAPGGTLGATPGATPVPRERPSRVLPGWSSAAPRVGVAEVVQRYELLARSASVQGASLAPVHSSLFLQRRSASAGSVAQGRTPPAEAERGPAGRCRRPRSRPAPIPSSWWLRGAPDAGRCALLDGLERSDCLDRRDQLALLLSRIERMRSVTIAPGWTEKARIPSASPRASSARAKSALAVFDCP